MRSCFVVGLLTLCTGCDPLAGGGLFDRVPCDAGLADTDVEALDGGVFDAGFCFAGADGNGGGGGGGDEADGGEPTRKVAPDCTPLLTTTCGPGGECAEDPGCVAATLLQRFEPESCEAAESDARSFPPCTQATCDELVAKVCGTVCVDAPGCAPAQILQARAQGGDVSAVSSCGSALSDESLFPPCGS